MNGGRIIDKKNISIYGIAQSCGSCWFDSSLMCLFVSDGKTILG